SRTERTNSLDVHATRKRAQVAGFRLLACAHLARTCIGARQTCERVITQSARRTSGGLTQGPNRSSHVSQLIHPQATQFESRDRGAPVRRMFRQEALVQASSTCRIPSVASCPRR